MDEFDGEGYLIQEELVAAKRSLAARIARCTRENGHNSDIPGLALFRAESPSGLIRYTHGPSVCLIAQGRKRIVLGAEDLYYDPDHCLVSSIDLPIIGQIIEASSNKPYLGLAFKLEQRTITQLLIEGNPPPHHPQSSSKALTVEDLSLQVLTAVLRLIDLIDRPESIPYLAESIKREIHYWLLNSVASPHLRQWAILSSHNSQISRAVDWIKENFSSPLSIDHLASLCRMSPSSFHHHFRIATTMSPLQYQKSLRLQEARRLMLMESENVTTAAFKVGYEGSSQFSREYRRYFGMPPGQDIRYRRLTPAPVAR